MSTLSIILPFWVSISPFIWLFRAWEKKQELGKGSMLRLER